MDLDKGACRFVLAGSKQKQDANAHGDMCGHIPRCRL